MYKARDLAKLELHPNALLDMLIHFQPASHEAPCTEYF
jgi:hypothetical protein